MARAIAIALSVILAFASLAPAQYYPPSIAPGDPRALVDSWYQRYLRRPADQGSAGWAQALQRGQHPEEVLATILGSVEYYSRADNRPLPFVRQLYLDVAGREPSAQEIGYWASRLRLESRKELAYQLLSRYPQNWQGNRPGYSPGYYPDVNSPTFPDPAGPYFKSYEYRRPIRAFPLGARG